MTRETWLILVAGGLGIVALGAFAVVGWRWLAPAKTTTYRPKHSGEFPIVPVPHKGAEDTPATSQWVHAIGSVPSLLDDPYINLRSAAEQLRLAELRHEDALRRVAEFEASRDAKTFEAWSTTFEERLAKAGQQGITTCEWTKGEFEQLLAKAGIR